MIDRVICIDKSVLLAVNSFSSCYWDSFMWNTSQTVTWIPFLLSILYVIYRNNTFKKTLLILFSIAVAIVLADQISSGFFKPIFHRFRPTHDPEISEMVRVVNGYKGGLYGFVSSHAANSFAAVTFIVLLLKNRILSLFLVIWAIIVCYSRMYLGVHFLGDILCGALVGIFSGWVGYKICVLLNLLVLKSSTKPLPYKNVIVVYLIFIISLLLLFLISFIGVMF